MDAILEWKAVPWSQYIWEHSELAVHIGAVDGRKFIEAVEVAVGVR